MLSRNLPVIVTGDFNAVPTDDPIKVLTCLLYTSLKNLLVDKLLVLTNGKVSQGVKDLSLIHIYCVHSTQSTTLLKKQKEVSLSTLLT